MGRNSTKVQELKYMGQRKIRCASITCHGACGRPPKKRQELTDKCNRKRAHTRANAKAKRQARKFNRPNFKARNRARG